MPQKKEEISTKQMALKGKTFPKNGMNSWVFPNLGELQSFLLDQE